MSSSAGYAWDYEGCGDSPPSPSVDVTGAELQRRFDVLGVLGKGGMGMVLRVREHETGRELALKLIVGQLESTRRQRFLREGQIAASLDHPGIVRVFGAGELDGRPYLAYELVEGARTLRDAFRGLSLRERVRCLRDAARAIGYAHGRGIVHRDLKPENVLLDAQGTVQVTDFGLATARDLDRLTQTGALVGTPQYLAPEQLQRGPQAPAAAADVWSLGVMLYEALTDRRPFAAETLLELGAQILSTDPAPPRRIVPSVPAALQATTLAALARRPTQRPADGEALAARLDAWLEAEAAPPAPVWVKVALAVAVGSLVVAGAVGWVRLGDRSATSPTTATPVASGPGPTPSASASPLSADAPAWLRALPAASRPPWPLPEGLTPSQTPGEFVWRADDSLMVWVPPATAQLGGGVHPATPPREVALSGFFCGKLEVTRAQYLAFCQRSGREPPVASFASAWGPLPNDVPITNVTWHDARAYCAHHGLRMLRDDEWEYAARGPQAWSYPWGDAEQPSFANLEGELDGHAQLAPVGLYPSDRSPFGCLDMAGNASEWVLEAPVHDPRTRFVRGSHYLGGVERAVVRGSQSAAKYYEEVGFRVALDP